MDQCICVCVPPTEEALYFPAELLAHQYGEFLQTEEKPEDGNDNNNNNNNSNDRNSPIVPQIPLKANRKPSKDEESDSDSELPSKKDKKDIPVRDKIPRKRKLPTPADIPSPSIPTDLPSTSNSSEPIILNSVLDRNLNVTMNVSAPSTVWTPGRMNLLINFLLISILTLLVKKFMDD